jgi:mRNA interferase RelE/StbE
LAWTIEYAEAAKKQLRKLDKPAARRIVDFMDERVAPSDDPRALGKALKGSLGEL